MEEILYKKESYDIMGAAFEVYKTLRSGFVEMVYQEALEVEFIKRGIPYEREKNVNVIYKGVTLKSTFRPDFICYGCIIVELKAVSGLLDVHRVQVYNYLRASSYKLGILLNFGQSDGVESSRILL